MAAKPLIPATLISKRKPQRAEDYYPSHIKRSTEPLRRIQIRPARWARRDCPGSYLFAPYLNERKLTLVRGWLPSATKMKGSSRLPATPPYGLLLALQVLESGRNDFGLQLRAVIVPALAVMQVAIDPYEPAFGAFLNDFLRQFPESDYRVPFD